ncbi:MAG: tRNA glutamyl-Q(34) synthetase GluQRS, partial [Gammaproteobacteria bacterium]|nr:tRNA glutamyl-Q(34) synthetase GluQRS [Gammaproteobacteria bacterium]
MAGKNISSYRGRFAPSPTGPLHFGSLVAAVGSYLEAKANNGIWLVRMEDIDPPREIPGAADDILKTLEQFGFEWDEEVLFQSSRLDAYEQAFNILKENEFIYPCSCSRKEIAITGKPGLEGTIYSGKCRNKKNIFSDEFAVRVKTGNNKVSFADALQGNKSCNLKNNIGDFIVRRRDGLFAYQLAVVIDDAEQKITHIVR